MASETHVHSVSGNTGSGLSKHSHTVSGTTGIGSSNHTHTYTPAGEVTITGTVDTPGVLTISVSFAGTPGATSSSGSNHTHEITSFTTSEFDLAHTHSISITSGAPSVASGATANSHLTSVASGSHTHGVTPTGSIS